MSHHPKRSDYRNLYKDLPLDKLQERSVRLSSLIESWQQAGNHKQARMYIIHHDYVLRRIEKLS